MVKVLEEFEAGEEARGKKSERKSEREKRMFESYSLLGIGEIT